MKRLLIIIVAFLFCASLAALYGTVRIGARSAANSGFAVVASQTNVELIRYRIGSADYRENLPREVTDFAETRNLRATACTQCHDSKPDAGDGQTRTERLACAFPDDLAIGAQHLTRK